MKLYMFPTVPLPIIRSLFAVHSSYRFVDSFQAGPGWNQFQCTANKLLMMGRGTVGNMWSFMKT